MFLTDELKKHNIKYRWEKTEGLMTTYKEKRDWIKSEEKAKDFYKRLQKDFQERSRQEDFFLSPSISSWLGFANEDLGGALPMLAASVLMAKKTNAG